MYDTRFPCWQLALEEMKKLISNHLSNMHFASITKIQTEHIIAVNYSSLILPVIN